MLLSEMFGVKRYTPFMVEGLVSVYKIGTDEQGIERIERVDEGASKSEVVYGPSAWRVINAAPSGIIHLPPPLTDGAREQLRALYTLGYRYITRTISLTIEAHVAKPRRVMNEWTQGGLHAYVPYVSGGIYGLPIKNETEPYDIGKALGVEE